MTFLIFLKVIKFGEVGLNINPMSAGLFFYLVVALGGGFPPPSIKFDPNFLEHWNLEGDSLYHVLQNMLIWKHNDKKGRHNNLIIVFCGSYTKLHNIRFRHLRDLKLGGMLAYIQFYKIWDFQIPTTWNDVMMTSSLCFLNLSIQPAKDNLRLWNFVGW